MVGVGRGIGSPKYTNGKRTTRSGGFLLDYYYFPSLFPPPPFLACVFGPSSTAWHCSLSMSSSVWGGNVLCTRLLDGIGGYGTSGFCFMGDGLV